MKLRNLFTTLVALAAVVTGCQKEGDFFLKEVQVSSSIIALPADGGEQTITVTATDKWEITGAPEWASVNPLSGEAGEVSVTVKAEAATESREATMYVACAGKKQTLMVIQKTAAAEVPLSTCKEVLDGPDSKTYRVSGAVTKITESATYGNFYLNDGTGDLYVYGTKYQGQTKQGALEKLGVEVGDIITVEGSKTTYNGTIELVDVDVVSLVKSLVNVDTDQINVEKEDTVVTVKVVFKGLDLKVEPQVDWINLAGINIAADSTMVSLRISANTEDTRTGTVKISSAIPSQTSEVTISVTQATGLDMYALPYAEDFSNGQGAYEVVVTTPRTDGKDIWTAGSYNGSYYMKATAGSKIDTKSMLVSPKISLKGAASPVLTFQHCGKFCGNQQEETTMWVSTDGGENWTQLLIPEHDNAYGWKESGDISLASLVGKEYFQIGFQYISNANYYGTWEIKDIKVEDRPAVITSIAGLNNAAATAEATYEVNLTDALVTFVSGSNVFIQDATAGTQLYMSSHGLTAGQLINGKVTVKEKLYSGYAELTSIDVTAATVTEAAAVTAYTLTLAELKASYLRYQNTMVALEGVSFTKGADGTAKTSDTITQGELTIDSRTQDSTIAITAGKAYDLVCFPSRYNATLQLGIWAQAHLTEK